MHKLEFSEKDILKLKLLAPESSKELLGRIFEVSTNVITRICKENNVNTLKKTKWQNLKNYPRDLEVDCYIYKITNLINNKIYIGQSINPKQRWKRHISQSKKINPEIIIDCAIKKYGIDNFTFEILKKYFTQKDADFAEQDFIKNLNSMNKLYGYNISAGGLSGLSGIEPANKIRFCDKDLEYIKTSNESYAILGRKFNCSPTTILRVCKELNFVKPTKIKKYIFSEEEVNDILETKDNKYLIEKYNCSYYIILKIKKNKRI